jgi:hypothetical protein
MFHSRFNQVLAIVVWVFCGGAVAAIIAGGIDTTAGYLPLVALVAFLAWAGLWRPSVGVGDDAVTVVNTFSTVVVPWATLIQVETRYALTLVTPHGRYAATAAPAPGRLATALSRRELGRAGAQVDADGRIRPGDLPNTDSGAAAYLVRERWERLVADGGIEIGVADTTPVERRWHWPVIAIALVLLAGAIAAPALG